MSKFKPVRLTVIVMSLLAAADAFAAGSGMPWESPAQKFLDSITGPMAKVIGTVIIIGTGFYIAHSEGGGLMRKVVNVVCGLSTAFTAGSFFLSFLGYGGGVGFGG